ncbi:MAG: hypothetical protein K2G85_10490 [Muribaculaceae bacterium]|nr:hypothetical protein [Muribaculaceae bacterium]
MKHTDFYSLHKKLDDQAEKELVAAIKAHGNEYIFIHTDEDDEYIPEEKNEAPIILASTKHMESYEDFYITRVVLDEEDYLSVYGFTKDGWEDEHELDSIAHGHLEYIIDHIPETDKVQDVTIS